MNEIQVGEERPAIPTWLRERLSKNVMLQEEQDHFDLGSYFDKNQEHEKRTATRMSKMTRDEEGSRIIQIAIPRIDKPEDEIIVEEFDLETINLGPPTNNQALEDMNDKVKTVHGMLKLK